MTVAPSMTPGSAVDAADLLVTAATGGFTLAGVIAGAVLSAQLSARARQREAAEARRLEQRDAVIALIGAARPWLTSYTGLAPRLSVAPDAGTAMGLPQVNEHAGFSLTLEHAITRARVIVTDSSVRQVVLELSRLPDAQRAVTGKIISAAESGTAVDRLAAGLAQGMAHATAGREVVDKLEQAALVAYSGTEGPGRRRRKWSRRSVADSISEAR